MWAHDKVILNFYYTSLAPAALMAPTSRPCVCGVQEPTLRRAGNADGDMRVVMPVRLSAFFETPQAERLLGRRL